MAQLGIFLRGGILGFLYPRRGKAFVLCTPWKILCSVSHWDGQKRQFTGLGILVLEFRFLALMINTSASNRIALTSSGEVSYREFKLLLALTASTLTSNICGSCRLLDDEIFNMLTS